MKISEKDIFIKVKTHLESLGYPTFSILPEYGFPLSKIDSVVRDKEKNLLAIEFKSNSISILVPTKEIGYHPITRKLQQDAIDLGAEYYLLTNGVEYLWLKTGLTGRPEKIDEICYKNFYNTTPQTESEFIQRALCHIAEHIRHFMITGDFMFDLSLVLYSQLAKERRENSIEVSMDHFLKDVNSKKNLDEAISRFSEFNVNLINQPEVVLSFIDDLFKSRAKELVVPRWLCDFMIKLLDQSKDATLIDVFGRNGIMLSSAYHNEYSNIYSFYTNQQDFYWLMIQQLLLSKSHGNLIHHSTFSDLYYDNIDKYKPDAVLLAPPFNLKIVDTNLRYDFRFQPIKDIATLFMLKSLEALTPNGSVVVIVPEGFLFSNNKSYTVARKYIKDYIEAVISLPLDTFRPYTSVKTSLLVLSKNKANKEEIFFANLDTIPKENIFFGQENNDINEIIFQIKKYRKRDLIEKSDNSFVVKSLETNNYQYFNYWYKQSHRNIENIDSKYQLIPLINLVSIIRGNSLVKDIEGDIPYISPAAIRTLELNIDKLDYTSKNKLENLSKHTLKYTEEGDILVNAIGDYLGKAALVTKDLMHMLVNRHIIVLRPNHKLINPGYLSIVLNTVFVQDQIQKFKSGVISSLNLASFNEILIPIINIEEQKKIYQDYEFHINELEELKNKQIKLKQEINSKLRDFGKRKEVGK